jgi:hypothetical protein
MFKRYIQDAMYMVQQRFFGVEEVQFRVPHMGTAVHVFHVADRAVSCVVDLANGSVHAGECPFDLTGAECMLLVDVAVYGADGRAKAYLGAEYEQKYRTAHLFARNP